MRQALIAMMVLAAGGAAAQTPAPDVTRAKPSWLSSKPVKPATKAVTPVGQWPLCIAALTPPGEDKARIAALADYRALYFQHAVKVSGLTPEAAAQALTSVARPPAFIAASCAREVPSPADRAFRAANPWAASYFDGTMDREMFTPVPMTE